MKYLPVLLSCCLFVLVLKATPPSRFNLMIAPGTLTENAVTVLWDKQTESKEPVYEILLNGKQIATTGKTNFTLTKLLPITKYKIEVRQQGAKPATINSVNFKTAATGKVYNVLDFGAKDDTTFKSTQAIQAAIDACTDGGTVYIPKGTFLSGALFLKSNMTLWIEKGGLLKGSALVADYSPMIKNRFEGWEMETYASLLNAGTLNRDGSYKVKNLRITGGGTLAGGGKRLGNAMIAAAGMRSRGRLILLMNCQNVSISNLTLTEPASWTLHFIYSNNVSCHDLNIVTNVRNGDGIDPDSSTDSYIFNCSFDTGDDCIAIKSGKNPEGFYIGKPTKNVRITNCDFKRGHGISIGSEMSGGVSDVLVQDCKAGALLHGLQIKGTKDRGGYVKNVTVTDCQLLKITVFSAVNYNNDGEPAPSLPTFENFLFRNIDLSRASTKEPVININGFDDIAHRLRKVRFQSVMMPENSTVEINNAENASFTGVESASKARPKYQVKNSSGILY